MNTFVLFWVYFSKLFKDLKQKTGMSHLHRKQARLGSYVDDFSLHKTQEPIKML